MATTAGRQKLFQPGCIGEMTFKNRIAMPPMGTNGFNDAANAVAASIGSRTISPRVAIAIAAIGNLAD